MKTVLKLAAAALLAAQAAPALAADDAKAAIEAQGAAFETALNAGDPEGVAQLYTEDAAIFPPDAPRIDGRDAIRDFWSGAVESGYGDLDLQTVEVHESGDQALEVGTLSLTAPAAEGGGRTEHRGKYVVLWQRGDDGTWRLHRDIWNMGQ